MEARRQPNSHTDVPATNERHNTRTRFDDFRMREYERQREAGDDDERGDEAAEVDGAGALVGGKVVTAAV